MIFSIIVASVFVFGGLVCYVSCWVAGRADEQSERYYYRKMLEKEAKKESENFKNEYIFDIIYIES
jgi:hypothetical protein